MAPLTSARKAIFAALVLLFGTMLAACATMQAEPMAASERSLSIETPDGSAAALLFTPAGNGPWPGVIVWPDLAGLRPIYKDIGRDLADQGYVVLIPNNFYRSVSLDGSQAVDGNLGRDEMMARLRDWRATASDEAIDSDARTYVAYLDGLKAVDKASKIGVVGYNVGAAHAFRSAAAVPGRIGAVAVAHPLGVATDHPNSPHLLVGKTKAAYLVAMAKPDDEREPGDKDDLREAFADAGLPGTVEVLDAGHGFALPDNRNYDAAAAARFRSDMLALFAGALR